MPRRKRQEEAGAVHHVFARGVEKRIIFIDDADRRVYLALLRAQLRDSRWTCLAFCLMGNHLHLVVETARPNLGEGMRLLHGAYARYFNDRHDRVGHLFQDRYGSSRLWSLTAVADRARYVEENPVRAGLCGRPEEWPWGSASGRSEEWPWGSASGQALRSAA